MVEDIVELVRKYTVRRGQNECWPWKGRTLKKDGRGTLSITRLTAARSLTPAGWLLLTASDIGADGMPMVVLGNPGPTPPLGAKGIGGRTLELTWCAAALRARAMETS